MISPPRQWKLESVPIVSYCGLLLANHRYTQWDSVSADSSMSLQKWCQSNEHVLRGLLLISDKTNRCHICIKHTTTTPQSPGACRFKAGDGVLKYFWLTFKVKQGLFCQDSAAVNLCSSESAALHTNANTARAITTSPFTRARFKNVFWAENDRLWRRFRGWLLLEQPNSRTVDLLCFKWTRKPLTPTEQLGRFETTLTRRTTLIYTHTYTHRYSCHVL